MSNLQKVCCIIDIDGFDTKISKNNGVSYRTEFFVRELAYVRVQPDQEFLPVSHRFDLRKEINFQSLSEQDRRTLHHQSKKITGLSIFPSPGEEVREYKDLDSVVRGMYETCQGPGLTVVAYKGGQKEKALLDRLGIDSLDLGLHGCPPYAKLIGNQRVYSSVMDCGYHKLDGKAQGLVHCPKAEVVVFRDWYMLNYKRCESAPPPEDDDDSEYDSDY